MRDQLSEYGGRVAAEIEPLPRLPGEFADELKVSVDVQHGEPDEFRRRGDEQIGN